MYVLTLDRALETPHNTLHMSGLQQSTWMILIFSALSLVGYTGVQALMQNPCTTAKTWSIVSVDPRFGVPTSSLVSYAKEASNVWNTAYRTNDVLGYKEKDGTIGISLVFDERQRTTLQNERLKQTIEEERGELNDIKETIGSLREEYDTLEKEIRTRTASYNSRLSKQASEVSYWNARGGAPTDVYQRLEREQSSLETERLSLNSKITRFNTLAEKIRQYAKDHNEVVSTINEKISTLNENALREFEEGTYDPNTRTITIYEFGSTEALKRVLAHELGHALGLNHVDDKESIMYPVNQGKTLLLSQADKDELADVCRDKTAGDVIEIVRTIRDDIVHLGVWSLRGIAAQLQ